MEATRNKGTASHLVGKQVMGSELFEAMSALSKREEEIKKWLADHKNEIEPQAHLDTNSTEQVYWRYGYLVALRDALKLLQRATLCSAGAGTSN